VFVDGVMVPGGSRSRTKPRTDEIWYGTKDENPRTDEIYYAEKSKMFSHHDSKMDDDVQ
jgi:hypothetical protein